MLVNEVTVCTTESQYLVEDIFEFNINNEIRRSFDDQAEPSKPRNNLFIRLYIEAFVRLSLSNKFHLRKPEYSQLSQQGLCDVRWAILVRTVGMGYT